MSQAQVNSKVPMFLWSITTLLITGAVIAGFSLTGGPQGQRIQKMDNQRVSDLGALSNHIQHYVNQYQALPESLDALTQSLQKRGDSKTFRLLPRDPLTKKSYGYQKKGKKQFALCATFQHDNRPPYPEDFERLQAYEKEQLHPKGTYCFDYELTSPHLGKYSVERQ